MAVNMLQEYGHEVVALGRRARVVDDWEILTGKPEIPNLDTITIYLNADNQKEYYDYFLKLKPRRVIFNPGAENPELATLLQQNGIKTENACTLVLLRTSQF